MLLDRDLGIPLIMPVANYQLLRKPDGYLSITPAPTANDLGKFYSEQYYQSLQTVSYHETNDGLELSYKTLKCSALLHAIKQAGVSGGEFFDISSGEGFLMSGATKSGYRVTSVDFTSFAIDRPPPPHKAADYWRSLRRPWVHTK